MHTRNSQKIIVGVFFEEFTEKGEPKTRCSRDSTSGKQDLRFASSEKFPGNFHWVCTQIGVHSGEFRLARLD